MTDYYFAHCGGRSAASTIEDAHCSALADVELM